jgi:predicted Zn-dependent protease with MMP-like domain
MKRMSIKKFTRLVAQAMAEFPPDLQAYLANVVVDVALEPDEEQLRAVGFTDEEIAAGATLLGLFEPFPLTAFDDSVNDAEIGWHRIWVFKRPHEDEFPDLDELRRQVRKTVIHEVAHHFGLSDRDLERWTSVY